MYDGITPTKFGRHAVAEPPRYDLLWLHWGEKWATVDHEPPIAVLDQEDLLAQGIRTSELVPGAPDMDALGSCTCNAGTASLAERLYAQSRDPHTLINAGLMPDVQEYTNSPASINEEFSIKLYHTVTDQTGDPAQEWPPTDCGSTGLYVCQELVKMGHIASYRSATNVRAALSLLGQGTVIMGAPWFNSWMEPNADGFVDGDGSLEALESAIASGVAGGHETCLTAIERVGSGDELSDVVIRVRNSWSAAWGDHGSYRIHASTLNHLGNHVDYKQFVI